MKRPIVQAILLIVMAGVCGIVANGFAPRQRKLVLPGYYPNAFQVPKRVVETPAAVAPAAAPAVTPAAAPAAAPAVEQSPAPGQPPVEIPTTTIGRPAGTATVAPPVVAPSKPAVTKPVVEKQFLPHPDKAYVEIGGDDVASLHRRGALFLDARRTSVYEEGHIAGARPFSVWESDIEEKVNKLFEERGDPDEQNQPIVIYCSGGACEDSHMLAQKLWGIQFNNVYVYKDGYPEWLKRGGPTRKGSTP